MLCVVVIVVVCFVIWFSCCRCYLCMGAVCFLVFGGFCLFAGSWLIVLFFSLRLYVMFVFIVCCYCFRCLLCVVLLVIVRCTFCCSLIYGGCLVVCFGVVVGLVFVYAAVCCLQLVILLFLNSVGCPFFALGLFACLGA